MKKQMRLHLQLVDVPVEEVTPGVIVDYDETNQWSALKCCIFQSDRIQLT
jgi:hypothetical protein